MAPADRFAAELLDASAPAYAAFAANRLLEQVPELETRFGDTAATSWRDHLTRRVRELASAVRAGEPGLFVARVQSTRREFLAHRIPEGDLRASLEALRETLAEELPEPARDGALACLDEALAGVAAPLADEERLENQLALAYLKTVLEGDARGAIDLVLKAIDEGLDPRVAYTDVLLPAQEEIGRLWHEGEVTVAEEHFVTDTTLRAMAIISHRAERAPPNGKTVVAAAVAGNAHHVGVRAAADLFELAGWRAVSLGADVPANDIAAAAEFFDADVVVLSVALIIQLKQAEESIQALRKTGRDLKILVGGAAFAEAPDLWEKLGADGYAPTALED